MPKYKFPLTNGRFLTLEGDTQPSDEEVEAIAGEQGVELQLAKPEPSIATEPTSNNIITTSNRERSRTEAKSVERPKGWLSRAWNLISEPLTTLPSEIAESLTFDKPSLETSPNVAYLKGLGSGALRAVGDVLSGLTSPINLSTIALSGGSSVAAKSGLANVARALSLGAKSTGVPVVAHGSSSVLDPKSTMQERGMGLAEVAGGLAQFGLPVSKQPATRIFKGQPKITKDLTTAVEESLPDLGLSEVFKNRRVPLVNASKFTPEEWTEINAFMDKGVSGSELSPIMEKAAADVNQPFDLSTIQFPESQPKIELDPGVRARLTDSDPNLMGSEFQSSSQPSRGFSAKDVTAEFLALDQSGRPMFNIIGGEMDKSTVGAEVLQRMGIAVPEVPADAVPMRGDALRAMMIAKRSAKMDARNPGFKGTVPETTAELGNPEIGGIVGFDQPLDIADEMPYGYGPGKPTRMDANSPGFRGIVPDESVDLSLDDLTADQIKATVPQGFIPKQLSEAMADIDSIPTKEKPGWIRKTAGFNRALLTAWDLGALGRQGKSFIFNKSYWSALNDMRKALGSDEAAKLLNEAIESHPSGYFRTGSKGEKSFAEKVGLDLAKQEEFLETNVAKALEKYSGVRIASRAHTAFLNKLRSDQFASMMDLAKKAGLDPEGNQMLAENYASFINNATGRGSLKIGKWNLEKNAGMLNDLFFAPRNMSGQIRTWNQILNPYKYWSADPVLRKQALRSLLAVGGLGLSITEMARLAGAKVSNDPTSSDFRKVRVGDTSIDLFGGYQQFPVAAMKLLTGTSTSTKSGKTTDLTAGKYGQQTRASVAQNYFTNRLGPIPSFIWAWMNNREFDGQPFEVKRALYERTLPIAMRDLGELAAEDPELAAVLSPLLVSGLASTQTYTRE